MDFDFLALMRFDMTFDVTLRDDSSVSVTSQIRVIKTSHFHFYQANFEKKEYLGNPST